MPTNNKSRKDLKQDPKSTILTEIKLIQEQKKSSKKLLMPMNCLKTLKEEECMI
jgi:hypothetical protein